MSVDDEITGALFRELALLGQVEQFGALLRGGVPPDVADGSGNTALLYAALHGHLELVELLIAYGAEVNVENDYGHTPVFVAASRGYTRIVEVLLRNGGRTDIRTNSRGEVGISDGETALSIAKRFNRTEVIELLEGPSPEIGN